MSPVIVGLGRWRRVLSSSAVVVVLLAVIAACGDDATPTPTTVVVTPTPTATGVPAWQVEMEQVTAAAKQEGNLVMVGFGEHHTRVGELFQEEYPDITVETNIIRSSEFIARMETERSQGLYLWDINMTGMSTAIDVFGPRGWLRDLDAAVIVPDVRAEDKWIGGWEAGFADLEERSSMFAAQETAGGGGGGFMYINRDCVTEDEFSTIDDLLKVDAAGDPLYPWSIITRRGSFGSFTTFLFLVRGEEFIRELLTVNPPLLDGDGRRLVEEALSCAFPVGDIGTDSVQPFHDLGAGLNLNAEQVFTGQPQPGIDVWVHCCGGIEVGIAPEGTVIDGFTSSGGGAIFMLAPAKNPNAAQLYINWFLGPAGMEFMAGEVVPEGNCMRRLDLPNNCAPDSPLMLQDGKTYVNGSNTSNEQFEVELTELANEVLGR